MDHSFFTYLQQLELLFFFPGYVLVYALARYIAGKPPVHPWKKSIITSLPYAYALVGTLYLGLQLKNLYPDYSFSNIRQEVFVNWLKIWGLLAVLSWLPVLARRPVISFLHSLVFFIMLVKDFFVQPGSGSIVRNDMKMYTGSLLLNLVCLVIISIITYAYNRSSFKKRTTTL